MERDAGGAASRHAAGVEAQRGRPGGEVNVSAKYWAEHMGPPYHQAAIRPLEQAGPPGAWEGAYMTLSTGSRRFTRYGYGDLLREDRRYGLIWRVWPGTQRVLLWGDPALAAGFGREARFGGALGTELFEPLSFKGRKGSGLPGDRGGYADELLRPPEGDWAKYRYTYRLLGRLLYNPEADAEVWHRYLRQHFGDRADAALEALANASRILPLVTIAHHPSAANYHYWPEIYTDVPIVAPVPARPYTDTPTPRRFGTVSPLDPALFSTVEQYGDEVVSGAPSGRYSPLDVARWLDGFAARAEGALARWDGAGRAADAEVRRWRADVGIQAALGRFFAGKLRAATGWALWERTAARSLLEEALAAYRAGREALAGGGARRGRLRGRPDLRAGPLAARHVARPAAGHRRGSRRLGRGGGWPGHRPRPAAGRGPAAGLACQSGRAAAGRPARPYPPGAIPEGPDRGRCGTRTRRPGAGRDADRGRAPPLPAREPGRALRSGGHGAGRRGLPRRDPSRVHRLAVSAPVLLRVRAADGAAWLSPGLASDLANRPYYLVRQVAPGVP